MPKAPARSVPIQLYGLTGMVLAVMAWSAWRPHDWPTWFLEATPALIALPLLAVIYQRFRFTALAYWMMGLHAVILLVGAHYTYAEVPFFNELREAWNLKRNHYDRIGHLAQGFIPAIVIREILLRRSPLQTGKWLFFVVTCITLAISAFYELIEWWVAVTTDDGAVAFLGTQGDPWDTQWDMCLALCGALAAQLLLSRTHDRQLAPFLRRSTRRN